MSLGGSGMGGAPIGAQPIGLSPIGFTILSYDPSDVFSPPLPPLVGLTKKREFNIHEARFGDGYSQTSAASTDYIRAVFELSWDTLSTPEAQTITTFLESKKGTQTFVYKAPGEASEIKFTCNDWAETFNRAGYRSIRATFRQSFNLNLPGL